MPVRSVFPILLFCIRYNLPVLVWLRLVGPGGSLSKICTRFIDCVTLLSPSNFTVHFRKKNVFDYSPAMSSQAGNDPSQDEGHSFEGHPTATEPKETASKKRIVARSSLSPTSSKAASAGRKSKSRKEAAQTFESAGGISSSIESVLRRETNPSSIESAGEQSTQGKKSHGRPRKEDGEKLVKYGVSLYPDQVQEVEEFRVERGFESRQSMLMELIRQAKTEVHQSTPSKRSAAARLGPPVSPIGFIAPAGEFNLLKLSIYLSSIFCRASKFEIPLSIFPLFQPLLPPRHRSLRLHVFVCLCIHTPRCELKRRPRLEQELNKREVRWFFHR